MASKNKTSCRYPGCPELVISGYCDKHRKTKEQYRASSNERGYNYEWQQYSKQFLKDHPLCVKCLEDDTITPSEVTDHIQPHKGNKGLFWDRNNHQALCKRCHDKKTAKEDGGFGRYYNV